MHFKFFFLKYMLARKLVYLIQQKGIWYKMKRLKWSPLLIVVILTILKLILISAARCLWLMNQRILLTPLSTTLANLLTVDQAWRRCLPSETRPQRPWGWGRTWPGSRNACPWTGRSWIKTLLPNLGSRCHHELIKQVCEEQSYQKLKTLFLSHQGNFSPFTADSDHYFGTWCLCVCTSVCPYVPTFRNLK